MLKPNDIKTQRCILEQMEHCNKCLDDIERICNGSHTIQIIFRDSFDSRSKQTIEPYYKATGEKIRDLIKEDLKQKLCQFDDKLKKNTKV